MPDGTAVGDVPGTSVTSGVGTPASTLSAGWTEGAGGVGRIAFAVGPHATANRDSTIVAVIANERMGSCDVMPIWSPTTAERVCRGPWKPPRSPSGDLLRERLDLLCGLDQHALVG